MTTYSDLPRTIPGCYCYPFVLEFVLDFCLINEVSLVTTALKKKKIQGGSSRTALCTSNFCLFFHLQMKCTCNNRILTLAHGYIWKIPLLVHPSFPDPYQGQFIPVFQGRLARYSLIKYTLRKIRLLWFMVVVREVSVTTVFAGFLHAIVHDCKMYKGSEVSRKSGKS